MIRAAFVFILGLAACSSATDRQTPFQSAIGMVRGDQVDVSPRFANLVAQDAPILQVGFINEGTNANVLLERRNGPFTYWLTSQGGHIILQSGMLHSSRGFGEGLLASELSEPLAMIRGLRDGTSDRLHTYLDGNDRAMTRTYRCVFRNDGPAQVELATGIVQTVLMTESCRSLDQEFLNFYWVVPSTRQIVQSSQWSGPEIGLISTRIVPR